MTQKPLHELDFMQNIPGHSLGPNCEKLLDSALGYCGLAPKARVLDVGCGKGNTPDILRKKYDLKAFGLDLSQNHLTHARISHPDLPLIRGGILNPPFAKQSFDLVICQCVLSLLNDPAMAYRQLKNLLLPGGYLVIMDVYLKQPDLSLKKIPVPCCFQNATTPQQTQKLLLQQGLDIKIRQDHSRLLTELAGQLIFSLGSLDNFWGKALNQAQTDFPQKIRQAKPGFHLIICKLKKQINKQG